MFQHVLSFINRRAFTHQGKIEKVNPKEYFVLCLLFSNCFLIWRPLIKPEGSACPWLCNKHDAIAWCLLGHQFFQGQLSEFPWQSFYHSLNPSGSFVLIFWVKCVLESMDLVNLGFPLGKKKKISPLIFTWAAQVVTFHCDCVVALCARNSHLWEPQLLVNEGESCNRN